MTPTHATATRWRRRLGLAAITAAAALLLPTLAWSPAGAAGGPGPGRGLERSRSDHERLASGLRDEAAAPAQPSGPSQRRSTPPVTVVVESRDVAATWSAVADAGGTVTEVAGNRVQAEVPPSSLGTLAEEPSSAYVREPYRALPQATSEGVAESGASAWAAAGKNGSGVKVAIVDVGFEGYQAKLGVELPATVETDFSRCGGDGDTNHGTAVAEVLHDVAPGAALYLVCVETDVEFVAALATLQSHGVKVVNGSIGFTLSGRGDGSGGPGSVAAAVAALRRQGILYVAAAGNYGQTHYSFAAIGDANMSIPWQDDFVDVDSDDALEFVVAPFETVLVSISWDEWPIARTDFDAFVVSQSCAPVSSEDDQTQAALPPVEAIPVTNCTGNFETFALLIDRFSGSGTPRMDVSFDGPVAHVERTSSGSVAEPASSPAVMAVGAHCYLTGAIEPYSSVGPTLDGRVKPDITGPDGVSNSVAGPATGTCATGFRGTSGAAPHVAGAAAVVLGTNPNLDVAELQQRLEDRSLDSGTAGKDQQFGSGRLRLGAVDAAAPPAPRKLTPLTPLRLFDSRPGPVGAAEGAFGASGRTTPLGPNSEVAIQVAGIAGVPADATAVVLNVTVTGPTQQGWITVHPDGAVPNSSNVNFVPGQTVADHVTATVGADDKVRFYNSQGSTDLVVDIAGYYGPTSSGNAGLVALPAPSRAFDSRAEASGFAEGTFGPQGRTSPFADGEEIQLKLAGLGGIPAGASAVVVNLTVTGPKGPGWFTLYPTGAARPLASNLNFVAGTTVANLAVVPVGTDGRVTLYSPAGSPHAVIDVMGYFSPGAGAGYVALDPPTRDLDSRTGNGPRMGPLAPGAAHRLEVARFYGVPARASAVLLSVIAVSPTATGWFTVYPGTASPPLASNLNFTRGAAVPNAVISGLGTDGTVAIANSHGSTHVVSDLAGYFVAP